MSNLLNNDYKLIMSEFYETMDSVLMFEWCKGNNELSSKVLDLILRIYNQNHLVKECNRLLEKAATLQTITDCNILDFENIDLTNDERIILDIKAQRILKQKVEEVRVFDLDIIMEETKRNMLKGVIGACKLYAICNWLELNSDAKRLKAINLWETLAYSGDEFSMLALIYAYHTLKDDENEKVWNEVYHIIRNSKETLSPIIEENYYNNSSLGALQKSEIILSIMNVSREKENELLNLAQIYYAINSKDTQDKKIENICNKETNYYILLLREKRIGKKKFGF